MLRRIREALRGCAGCGKIRKNKGSALHGNTELRPVSVTGFEGTKNERNLRKGSCAGQFGMEMVTLENGGLVNSIHGGLYRNSIWYSMYGGKGEMESGRNAAKDGDTSFCR